MCLSEWASYLLSPPSASLSPFLFLFSRSSLYPGLRLEVHASLLFTSGPSKFLVGFLFLSFALYLVKKAFDREWMSSEQDEEDTLAFVHFVLLLFLVDSRLLSICSRKEEIKASIFSTHEVLLFILGLQTQPTNLSIVSLCQVKKKSELFYFLLAFFRSHVWSDWLLRPSLLEQPGVHTPCPVDFFHCLFFPSSGFSSV